MILKDISIDLIIIGMKQVIHIPKNAFKMNIV